MALTRTTLAVAQGLNDKTLVVASATGFAAGSWVLVDNEMELITKDYVSGVTIPVIRGQNGTEQKAHVITAGVVVGLGSDFDNPAPGGSPVVYAVQRPTLIQSITATSTLTLPPAGSDLRVILNGTSVITLTVPVPTADMDGTMLTIISNGAAAHVITFTGGLGGAGTSYDVITNNATGRMALVVFAANLFWNIPQAPALTGTVTNITGGLA